MVPHRQPRESCRCPALRRPPPPASPQQHQKAPAPRCLRALRQRWWHPSSSPRRDEAASRPPAAAAQAPLRLARMPSPGDPRALPPPRSLRPSRQAARLVYRRPPVQQAATRRRSGRRSTARRVPPGAGHRLSPPETTSAHKPACAAIADGHTQMLEPNPCSCGAANRRSKSVVHPLSVSGMSAPEARPGPSATGWTSRR